MKPKLAPRLCAALLAAAVSAPVAAQTDGPSLRLTRWLPRLADSPPRLADSPPRLAHSPTRLTHWPMRPYRNADGTFRRLRNEVETSNWSGYAVTAAPPYAAASATWQVPNVAYDGGQTPYGYEYVSNWVGIGGDGDETLIQLGTESVVSTVGVTTFYLWYELYPAVGEPIALTVKPGDVVAASLQCTAACSPGQTQTWQLTMSDQTAKSAWTQSFQYQSSMASAEWITEPPYYGGILPLADYDQATFDPVEANGTNPNLSLSANGIIAADPWGETSNPSSPVAGDVFSTCWGGQGSLTPCTAGSFNSAAPPPPAPPPPAPPPPPVEPPPTVSLSASPTTTPIPGIASKLIWSSANAGSCKGSGFTVVPAGWALVFPRVTTSYAITCTATGGDAATAMVTVTVK